MEKKLRYNNSFGHVDAAVNLILSEFHDGAPAFANFKTQQRLWLLHVRDTLDSRPTVDALAGDPVSAFGGVLNLLIVNPST